MTHRRAIIGHLGRRRSACAALALIAAVMLQSELRYAGAQTNQAETPEQKVQRLTAAVALAQAQIDAYQNQLSDLQRQILELQGQVGAVAAPSPVETMSQHSAEQEVEPTASNTQTDALQDLRERQAVDESQIATHELSKVETESKYPLKLSGLILFNGYVNTSRVDIPPDPTYAQPGGGNTGFSLRQTVLGFDARGPHLMGATSHADLRVDFFGSSAGQSQYGASGLLRLRTAHASLDWGKTEGFAELDRPIIAPNVATSLVAVAEPLFAWSGDLWAWNPQIGVSHSHSLSDSSKLVLQAALIDPADPRLQNATTITPVSSLAERSRWPGTEARIAFARGERGEGLELGVGGYVSPHRTPDAVRFNAWAGTLDVRMPVGKHIQVLASAYRGMALGGLGGGGYVDYFYQYAGTTQITRPLDTVGGWTQLKVKPTERWQFNAGFGIDNPFAREIHWSPTPAGYTGYAGLARNRQAFGNVIYSPSAYLLFSLEYRRLMSNYAIGPTYFSDAIGVGAGYRF